MRLKFRRVARSLPSGYITKVIIVTEVGSVEGSDVGRLVVQ